LYFSGIFSALGILLKSSFSISPCSPPRMQSLVGVSTTSHTGFPVAPCVFDHRPGVGRTVLVDSDAQFLGHRIKNGLGLGLLIGAALGNEGNLFGKSGRVRSCPQRSPRGQLWNVCTAACSFSSVLDEAPGLFNGNSSRRVLSPDCIKELVPAGNKPDGGFSNGVERNFLQPL
jgi:hypothetical protein